MFVERSCGCKIFLCVKKYELFYGKQGDVFWLTKFSKRSQTSENAENVLRKTYYVAFMEPKICYFFSVQVALSGKFLTAGPCIDEMLVQDL